MVESVVDAVQNPTIEFSDVHSPALTYLRK